MTDIRKELQGRSKRNSRFLPSSVKQRKSPAKQIKGVEVKLLYSWPRNTLEASVMPQSVCPAGRLLQRD